MSRRDNAKQADKNGEMEDTDSFCSKASFYFLVTPRSSLVELAELVILAAAYSGCMTYMIHADTLNKLDEGDRLTYQILTLVVVLFSSYSLMSLPIPESTPYQTNDSYSLFSHHY